MTNAGPAQFVKSVVKEEEFRPDEAVLQGMSKRYGEGYRVASFINGLGTVLKVLGVAAGVFLGGTGLLLPTLRLGPVSTLHTQSSTVAIGVMVTGLLAGALVWLALFVTGVFISAQGQMVRAAIDAAVNSSPLFDTKQKVYILTAPPK